MYKKKHFLSYLILIIGSIVTFFPLFWMIVLSLSDNPASSSTLGELIRKGFSFKNFSEILSADKYGLYFFNSLFTSLVVDLVYCIICSFVLSSFACIVFSS